MFETTTVRQEDPVRGYRFAKITNLGPTFSLCGVDRAFPFDLEDTAQCCAAPSMGAWHTPPDDDCACGFYSVANHDRMRGPEAWTKYGFVLLHCDYYGVILEHEELYEGKPPLTVYRSEVQHVIAMEHPVCLTCLKDDVLEPASAWLQQPQAPFAPLWLPACFLHSIGLAPGAEVWPLRLPGLERLEILRFMNPLDQVDKTSDV